MSRVQPNKRKRPFPRPKCAECKFPIAKPHDMVWDYVVGARHALCLKK